MGERRGMNKVFLTEADYEQQDKAFGTLRIYAHLIGEAADSANYESNAKEVREATSGAAKYLKEKKGIATNKLVTTIAAQVKQGVSLIPKL